MLNIQDLSKVMQPLVTRVRNLESQEVLIKAFYKQYATGDLYISENPDALGQTNNIMTDFWFDVRNRKFRARALNFAELDNRVQFIGARFLSPDPGASDQYTVANSSVGPGDHLVGLIGAGAVAGLAGGGTRPDALDGGQILITPDPRYGGWTASSTPGLIIFNTVPPNNGGGIFSGSPQTILDATGNWTMGIWGGVWSSWPESANYVGRLNLRGEPVNTNFTAINFMHADDPAAGETGQSILMLFQMRGASGAGFGWVEAGRITLSKFADFTTAVNQSAQLRISLAVNSVMTPRLTLDPEKIEMHGMVLTVAADTDRSSIRIPHANNTPAAPVDGDMWTDTAGAYIRINGVTKTFTLV